MSGYPLRLLTPSAPPLEIDLSHELKSRIRGNGNDDLYANSPRDLRALVPCTIATSVHPVLTATVL
jgi:hypothetical protein